MRNNSKTKAAVVFSMLFAVVFSLAVFTAPVSAADSAKAGVAQGPKTVYLKALETSGLNENKRGGSTHADPATFEKNFCLSAAQKEYTITEIERVVARILKPGMSDLEKYYRLAVWENKRAKYDWEFWDGDYNFELYRHQWDSFGVLTEKSVCVGMAITYAALCHAADLPCKFVRTDTSLVDHTMNYIPDINGNAYCVDVTENAFLMSQYAENYFIIDKGFAYITKDCTDGSFEYHKTIEDLVIPDDSGPKETIEATNIKDCYGITYDDWFREYALHENTEKDFRTPYVEKGSGLPATDPNHYHASYHDYPKQFSDTEKPGIWFLEDFYKNPEEARSKILNKEFDEQFLNISGLRKKYELKSEAEIAEDIRNDLSVKYFPSSEAGEVIAWAADLKADTDFTVTCTINKSKSEAEVAIAGIGDYKGTYVTRVKLNNMTVKGKTATVKYSKVRNQAQTIKRNQVIAVSKAMGKLHYDFMYAKKGRKDYSTKFKVDRMSGNVTVKKGLEKGTYKIRTEVMADGNPNCSASVWKTVIFKVRVQ